MQPISEFLNVTKVIEFWWKNADVRKTERAFQVIYV